MEEITLAEVQRLEDGRRKVEAKRRAGGEGRDVMTWLELVIVENKMWKLNSTPRARHADLSRPHTHTHRNPDLNS